MKALKEAVKIILADISFFIGHRFIILSARLMGYPDVAKELKNTQAHWLKKDAFRIKS